MGAKRSSLGGLRMLLLFILPYFSSSCGHKDATADSKLVGIFSDFTFVGSAPYSQTAEAQTTVPPTA
jgi:hypothetical protein